MLAPGQNAMLKVLLVNGANQKVGRLHPALLQAGCEVVEVVSLPRLIPVRVARLQPDVIIIDADAPARDVLEQICVVSQDEPRPVLMVSNDRHPAAIKAAIRAGVSAYVIEGIDAGRLEAMLAVAQARFEEGQSLKQQVRVAEDRLEERKRVERAKGMLMQLRGLNETDAYHAMRKMAMDRNIRIADVAEKLLAMNDRMA